MKKLTQELLTYMMKWSGSSGGLLLVNVMKKLYISDLDNMNDDQREKLLNSLTKDYLSSFLGHSKFLVARAELVSILGMNSESYRVHDRAYRAPVSPNLLGKPQA